jgi:hypothetical protein
LSGVGIITPFDLVILADAQFITKPHKTALAAARRSGSWPNITDHYARAKTRRSAQPAGDENAFRELAK